METELFVYLVVTKSSADFVWATDVYLDNGHLTFLDKRHEQPLVVAMYHSTEWLNVRSYGVSSELTADAVLGAARHLQKVSQKAPCFSWGMNGLTLDAPPRK